MKYDNLFKEEAIRLSDEIGIKNAAAQLGITYYTLADWRKSKNRNAANPFPGSGNRKKSPDEKDRRIFELEAELRETKRANAILQEALGFFASSRKK